mmetsp:Transcript_1191/g.2226  ORF Transcript_1191/g.2226 Transcript_1191/m.2226 type:complete len:451 (-) Transcript_1191:321-1673(-)
MAGRWGPQARALALVFLALIPASSQTVRRAVARAPSLSKWLPRLHHRRSGPSSSRSISPKAMEVSPEAVERGSIGADLDRGAPMDSRLEAYPPFDANYPGVEQIHSEPPVFLVCVAWEPKKIPFPFSPSRTWGRKRCRQIRKKRKKKNLVLAQTRRPNKKKEQTRHACLSQVHGLLSDAQCDALVEAARSESLGRIRYSGNFILLDQEKLRPLVPLCLVAGVPPIVHALEQGDALPSALGPAAASAGFAALAMAGLVKAVPMALEKVLWAVGGGACFTGTKWGTDSLEATHGAGAAADAYAAFLANAQRVLFCAEKERFERPTVTRYGPGEFQRVHTDARPPGDPDGLDLFLANGGQRLAQCIVYLNSLDGETQKGHTAFHAPELQGLKVTPKKGTALVFFPSFRDGGIDHRMTHSGCAPVGAEKWIMGTWLCQSPVPAWKQKRCVGDIV